MNDTVATAALAPLAKALAKAQAEITGAVKDTVNTFFNSKYATLANVWDACRGPLSKNGLSVVQKLYGDHSGVTVTTILLHESGCSMASDFWVPVVARTAKDGRVLPLDAQAYGSASTYARRYGLSAMVGVAPEDDDGNAVSSHEAPGGVAALKAKATTAAQLEGALKESVERGHSNHEIQFGKSKGKRVSELDDKSLAWYRNAAIENADNPEKAQWRPQQLAAIATFDAELAYRAKQNGTQRKLEIKDEAAP